MAFSSLLLLRGARRPLPKPKRGRGRPKKAQPPSWTLPARMPRGRPKTFTLDLLQRWVTDIDRAQEKYRKRGAVLTDGRALQLQVRRYMGEVYEERFRAAGKGPREAHRLAFENMRAWEESPKYPKWMKKQKERLSRARRRVRDAASVNFR
jgi:hypothetical protein